MVNPVHA